MAANLWKPFRLEKDGEMEKIKKIIEEYDIKLINNDKNLFCEIPPKDDELKFLTENKQEVIKFLKKEGRYSLSPNEVRIREEIGKLEGSSGAVVVLVILGIIGIFFFIIPGIILFVAAAVISSSRKSKAASLRAQLESLRYVKSTKSQLETKKEEDPLKILKKRFAEGKISEKEFKKKKELLK